MKIKKGDTVKIVRGKDKGKQSTVEAVFTKDATVLVAQVNTYKRHRKGMQGQKSEILTITKPLPMANVMVVCPKCNLPTRVGYTVTDGKKVRVCKKCEQEL